ncbi:MFS transporter [Rhodococcus sp. ACS1]|uniref:MFS transporter n=1 Tax=Rhodococcus sp. ACS1 TaxID=2028570 RepID=UPI0015CE00DD|nr:MFS transporter [Rhodococcus sp. ACS1]
MSSSLNNSSTTTQTHKRTSSSPGTGWNLRRIIVVLALVGSLVGAIATVLLGPQGLPFVSAEFNTDQGAWFVTLELIAAAVLTPLAARMGELYGKRRIIIALVVVGTIGSVLIAIAPAYWVVLAGRFLQGATLACAALAPALVREALPERIAPFGVGLVATGSGLPGALIPFITGPVIDNYGFRVVFWGVAAVMAIFAVLILATIPESTVFDSGSVDYVSVLLLGGGVAAILAGLSFGPSLGWASAATIVLFIVGIVAIAIWVRHSRASQNPLIDLSILTDRRMTVGLIAGGLVAGTGTLFLIASSYVAQTPAGETLGYGLGLSARSYAYLQTFYFLGFLVGGVIAVQALQRMSYIGVILGGAGLLGLSAIIGVLSFNQVLVFAAVHLIIGIVIGVFFSANFNFIFRSVAATRRSSASSLYLTMTTLGQSLYSILPLTIAAMLFPAALVGVVNVQSIRFLFFFILGSAIVAALLAVCGRKAGQE